MDCLTTCHGVPRWYLGRVLLYHTVFWNGKVCDGIADCQVLTSQLLGKCHTFSSVLFIKEIDLCIPFCVGQQVADMC